MRSVVFWGATGQARVLREALSSTDFSLLAVFDNRSLPSPFRGIPIHIGKQGFDDWKSTRQSSDPLYGCVAIGGVRGMDRIEMQEWLHAQGVSPLTVVHPRAFVASDAEVGAGSQILALAAVCANAKLGRSVIVNTAASVDHDCQIGDGVHVAPGARVTGEVQIGDYAFIGAGAIILPGLRIGRSAIVGAGATVIRDVPQGHTVAGTPATVMKKNFRTT